MEFVPLALLDSVESGEVSYPSVTLSLDQVHITYTYKRAYIKSLVLSKSALVRQAQEMLKRKAQAESSSLSLRATAPADSTFLPFALDSSMDCHADKSARNDKKPNLSALAHNDRSLDSSAQASLATAKAQKVCDD